MTSSHGGKKMWCVGELDNEYIFKMEDVLKIYEKPLSEREPVVCVDEKPVVLHEDTRPSIPMQPGKAARRDYEYERCGTANVFCGIEPKAGVHFTKVTPTRASPVRRQAFGLVEPYYCRPSVPRVCRLHPGDCCELSCRRHHPSGHGQLEHPYPQGVGGSLR